jgi:hypothetical protein
MPDPQQRDKRAWVDDPNLNLLPGPLSDDKVLQRHPDWKLRGTPDEIPEAALAGPRPSKGGSTVPQIPGEAQSVMSLFGSNRPNVVGPGAVPQGGGASDSNASDNKDVAMEMIRSYSGSIDPSILRAGLTPVPTGPSTSVVPPSLTRPVGDFKERPMNTQPVVGAGNARARGIGNAITGLTNAVGQVVHAKKQLDQDKLSVSTQRLLQSQQAINQANQFLQDPNIDPSRKQALMDSVTKNQKIMNTMLDDPKLRKDLEKGLNISFTDPSKNQTDQHNAVQEGIKSMQEQFAEQMPQTVGPDPMATFRMQEAIREQTAGQKLLQSVIPRILSAKDAMERTKLVQFREDKRQVDRHSFEAARLAQQFANSKELAGLHHTYRLGEIGEQMKQMGQKAMELFQNEHLDPTILFNEQQKFYTQMAGVEGRITGAQGATVTALAQLGAALGKTTDSDAKAQISAQIKQMQDFQKNLDLQMTNLQGFKGRYNKVIKHLQDLSAGQAPANGGQDDTGTSSTGIGAGATGGAFDPSALLYGVPFSAGGALPPIDGSSDSDDTGDDDNPE